MNSPAHYRLAPTPRGRPPATPEQRLRTAVLYRLKRMKPEDRAALEPAIWAAHYRRVKKMAQESLESPPGPAG